MRHELSYSVSAEIKLSFAELKELWAHSSNHYDYMCKRASRACEDGFLHAWANQFIGQNELNDRQTRAVWAGLENAAKGSVRPSYSLDRKEVEVNGKFRLIDRCAKMLEIPLPEYRDRQRTLPWELRQVLLNINDEVRRLNYPEGKTDVLL